MYISDKKEIKTTSFLDSDYFRKLKVRFHSQYASSPERWEISLSGSTNSGDEVRR